MATPRTKEPDPDLGQGVVDKDRYLSSDIAACELDRIFRRSWLYAVPGGDGREAGSWAGVDLGPESVLIVRTEDGALAAHHNVCQHRGRRLMDDERGRAAAFRCAYHAWTYRLDGELRTIHEPQLLPADLDRCFVRQDAANVVRIQQGLRSSGYDGARLGALELRLRHWHAVYGRALGLEGEHARGHDATDGGGPP